MENIHIDLAKIEPLNVKFFKDEFPNIGDVKRDLELYELNEEVSPLFGKEEEFSVFESLNEV